MERTITIIYEKYCAYGINSFGYQRKEYKTTVDRFWTVDDALNSFRANWLGKLDRIVEVVEL